MRVGEAERSIAYAFVLNKNFNLYSLNNFLHVNIILPVLLVFFSPLYIVLRVYFPCLSLAFSFIFNELLFLALQIPR